MITTKIITINVPEDTVEFFDKVVKELNFFPSRSEGIRQCINLAMPYIMNMIEYMRRPLLEEEIERIRMLQNELIQEKAKTLALEYIDKLHIPADFKTKFKYTLGNKFWDEKLVSNQWIKVPIEPDKPDEEEVYVDGKGYIPISRLEDVKRNGINTDSI